MPVFRINNKYCFNPKKDEPHFLLNMIQHNNILMQISLILLTLYVQDTSVVLMSYSINEQ